MISFISSIFQKQKTIDTEQLSVSLKFESQVLTAFWFCFAVHITETKLAVGLCMFTCFAQLHNYCIAVVHDSMTVTVANTHKPSSKLCDPEI